MVVTSHENEETGDGHLFDTRDERKKLRLRGCEDRGRRGILSAAGGGLTAHEMAIVQDDTSLLSH